MRNKYQRKERKSNNKFEVVEGQELLVQVPLPMAEVKATGSFLHSIHKDDFTPSMHRVWEFLRKRRMGLPECSLTMFSVASSFSVLGDHEV